MTSRDGFASARNRRRLKFTDFRSPFHHRTLSHLLDKPMVLIDWAFYPHIRDLILDFAPDEAIPALRLTQRAVRDAVDRRIAEHAVYVIDPPRMYTKRGHINLPFQSRDLKWRTRMLDVHAGKSTSYNRNEGLPAHFPNVHCVRLHGQTSGVVVERLLGGLSPSMVLESKFNRKRFLGEQLCAPSSCKLPLPVVIQPLIPRATEDYHIALGTFLTGCTTKLVAVFPQDLSKLHCDEIDFGIHAETKETELVVLFLPSFSPEPPIDERLLECKYSYDKFSWDIHGAFMTNAGKLTIVGLRTWQENTGDHDPDKLCHGRLHSRRSSTRRGSVLRHGARSRKCARSASRSGGKRYQKRSGPPSNHLLDAAGRSVPTMRPNSSSSSDNIWMHVRLQRPQVSCELEADVGETYAAHRFQRPIVSIVALCKVKQHTSTLLNLPLTHNNASYLSNHALTYSPSYNSDRSQSMTPHYVRPHTALPASQKHVDGGARVKGS